jgi:hypothetical protein
MTIQITKPGSASFSAACRRCKCEFMYQLEGLRRNYTRGGREEVSCPGCGHSVEHSAQQQATPRSA